MANSIRTNASAMTALKALNATNKSLEQTQSRISTGMRVAEASDNAAYWSIATTMRSDSKALSTVQDALGLGSAKVDTAYTGMKASIKVVDEIKAKLVAAKEPGVDKAKIQTEVKQLQENLKSISDSAAFSGENWLSVDSGATGYSATKSIVASFTRASDGTVSVGKLDINVGTTKLFDSNDQSGILDNEFTIAGGDKSVTTLDITSATNADLDDMVSGVDAALQTMTTSAADLGAAKTRISLQKDFVSDLMDAIDSGVGQLVDADMNQESTRLSALQTQQQLGIQSLSIANSSSQTLLSLFRG